jgi:hypothetical protein
MGKVLRRKASHPTPSLLGQFSARHVHAGEAGLTANEDQGRRRVTEGQGNVAAPCNPRQEAAPSQLLGLA